MSGIGHNRLTALAAEICSAHDALERAAKMTAERALALGALLVEAKAKVPHGQWDTWLGENTRLSSRSARRYMQLARSGLETATVADLGIRGAAEELARSACRSRTDGEAEAGNWRQELIDRWEAADPEARHAFLWLLLADGDITAEQMARLSARVDGVAA